MALFFIKNYKNFCKKTKMSKGKIFLMTGIALAIQIMAFAQEIRKEALEPNDHSGFFSLGVRSTTSVFSDDGFGLGTGGQFRIQLSNKVNTDWFADFIVINDDNVRSEYIHIGWSVLFYPFEKLQYPNHKIQPFILAGHCFDYNKKTILTNPSVTLDRWGSAVQAGIGTHFNLSDRFDITLMSQYMIHLTNELKVVESGGIYSIEKHSDNVLHGHLLTTVSLNYKLFKLWK